MRRPLPPAVAGRYFHSREPPSAANPRRGEAAARDPAGAYPRVPQAMTDEPLRANPEDRPAPPSGERKPVPAARPADDAAPPVAAAPETHPDAAPVEIAADLAASAPATAHTRPIRPVKAGPVDRRPAWSGFLLGVLVVGFAIGLAGLLWRFGGGESPMPAPAVSLGQGELVEMETLLDQLGFPPGKLDGVIDGDSIAAIRDFQLTAGLPVDGTPSAALLEELRAALAELSG